MSRFDCNFSKSLWTEKFFTNSVPIDLLAKDDLSYKLVVLFFIEFKFIKSKQYFYIAVLNMSISKTEEKRKTNTVQV